MRNLFNSIFLLETIAILCGFAFIISCSEDDTGKRKMAGCDEDSLATYTGTICCVVGPLEASPGESLTYEYKSNIENPEVTWEVISGSITITSGQNSSTATFTFGDDFTTGHIVGSAHGDDDRDCSEGITISKWVHD